MILSGWQAVFFWLFAISAIFAGLLTVMARNAVHSALFLISSLMSVAALFILLGAEFIAGVQILVYVGGVMVLFLFVIMLVNVGAEERGSAPIFNSNRQVAASLVFCALLVFGLVIAAGKSDSALSFIYKVKEDTAKPADDQPPGGGPSLPVAGTGVARRSLETERVGTRLYSYASLPFEIASVLLLVAIIGSVMLARTLKQEAAADDLAPEVFEQEVQREPELATVPHQGEET